MKGDLLLDTQAFLWFWWDDPQLSVTAKRTICDPSKRKLISTASALEVAIKVSLKKLDLGAPYRGFIHQHMVRNNFEWLQITDEHLAGVVDLPFHHKNPFDRMLVAQGLYEQIPIVSADPQLDPYGEEGGKPPVPSPFAGGTNQQKANRDRCQRTCDETQKSMRNHARGVCARHARLGYRCGRP